MAISDLLKKLTQDDEELEDLSEEYSEDDGFVDEPLFPEDDLEPDPMPSRAVTALKGAGDKVVKTRAQTKKLTKSQKTLVMDKFEMMLKFPGMIISTRDPICGGAIANNSMQIAESMIPIIARNPQMLEWFTAEGGGFMDYIGVAWACMPVVTTIYQHHVSHSIGDHVHEEEDYVYSLPDDL